MKIIIFYKAERELIRQRLQSKKGKEEGKESKELGQQIWQCKNGASERVESHRKKTSPPKTDGQEILKIIQSNNSFGSCLGKRKKKTLMYSSQWKVYM